MPNKTVPKMGRPRVLKDPASIEVTAERADIEAAKRKAKTNGESVSEVFRRWLQSYLCGK